MRSSWVLAASALIRDCAAWGPHDNHPQCSHHSDPDPGPGVESVEIGGGGNSTYWEYQIFKSSPFNPPVWQIETSAEELAPGLIFVTPSDFSTEQAVKQPAPQIFTDKGQLVWSGPTSNATNFKYQYLNGEPILTFASGFSTLGGNIGHGYVNVSFLDSSYNYKTVLCPNFNLTIPGNETFECQADLHEFITDQNTILVSAYNATQADLTVVGGSADGWVFDCLFFELEPFTGDILFRWSALEHVALTESHQPLLQAGTAAAPWDWFHINSVINIGEHYLVNSRHTWTVYYTTGEGDIVWRFNGETGGDFGPLPSGGTFRWQHHPRAHNVTETSFDMSIFNNDNQALDNSSSHPTNELVYHLPFLPNNATPPVLTRRLANSPQLFADSQGSYQPSLSNGNQFTTFGQLPLMKEYGPATNGSDVRWTARAGADGGTQLYRGFKEVWHATPSSYPPSLVVDGQYGYVSWNGATDVDGWNVYAGESSRHLQYVGQSGSRGFETRFDVACWAKYVQVGAVVNGTEVKRSEVVSV